MLADVVAFLSCPHCEESLVLEQGALRCQSGHSFDVARQGYVNLVSGGGGHHRGDDAAMLSAREAFLTAGYLDGIRDAITGLVHRALPISNGGDLVVDAGAGTGFYLAAVLNSLSECVGIALDSSSHALRRAARAHPRLGAVGCDIWKPLPLKARSAALILDIFSPRNGPEFRRIIQPHGRLIVVTPTPRHLEELVAPLGLVTVDTNKPQRLEAGLAGHFVAESSEDCRQRLELQSDALAAVVNMGPSARHLSSQSVKEGVTRLLDEAHAATLTVTISVTISLYRPIM